VYAVGVLLAATCFGCLSESALNAAIVNWNTRGTALIRMLDMHLNARKVRTGRWREGTHQANASNVYAHFATFRKDEVKRSCTRYHMRR